MKPIATYVNFLADKVGWMLCHPWSCKEAALIRIHLLSTVGEFRSLLPQLPQRFWRLSNVPDLLQLKSVVKQSPTLNVWVILSIVGDPGLEDCEGRSSLKS